MLVYLAILMPVLVLFCGLVVDVGQLEVTRLRMQSASDAAALGAAQSVERDGIGGSWVSDGQSDAATNGFTNGSANTTVTVVQQPTYGAYAGFYDAVQTTVTQQVPLTFLKMLGSRFSTVTAQATALVAPCVYISGASNLTTPAVNIASSSLNSTCPWYINSSATMDSNSNFAALAENMTGSAGASNWTVGAGSLPRYNVHSMADPLASVTQPTVGPCVATNMSVNYTTSLSPGTYCGTFTANCQANQQNSQGQCILYTQPGLYVFTGNVSINYAVFFGTGGTLFFTRNGVNNSSTGNVSFTNYAAIVMSAPTSTANGGIPGVVIMNDRNWTHTNTQDFKFTTSYLIADGLVYVTGTGLSLSGCYVTNWTQYLGLDTDNLLVSNGTNLTLRSDFSSVPGGSPMLAQGGLVQ